MRRERNFIGPAGMGGTVGLWGASSLIKSIQQGTLAFAGGASATATIAAVDVANAVLVLNNHLVDFSTGNTSFNVYLTFTNTTTITATRVGIPNTETAACVVIEFMPGVIRSVQRGTIFLSGVASNTATITVVNTAKSFVNYLGMNTNVSDDQTLPIVSLTNGTTVTATREDAAASGGTTTSYQVVEFF